MRRIEWALGSLSGLLGLAALAFSLTHQIQQRETGTVIYGPGIGQVTTTSVLLSAGLAVVAALLVALSAWQDARRQTRGGWRWLALLGAALSVVGVYLLILSDLWVAVAGPPPSYVAMASVALLFMPSALAAILCAVVAALPRGQRQAPALA
ncbi:MAG: hypothetical protein ACRDID_23485 [Ktedonobacterales bacterium]